MDPELIFAADGASDRGRPLAKRCAAGELVRVRRGVYVASAEWNRLPRWERDRLRITAAVETGRGPRVLVQQSAALIWGIPVIGASTEILLLSSQATRGRRRGDLRWTERKLLESVTQRDGADLTTRAQTVIDMAAYLPFRQAVPAMDHVLRPDPVRGFEPIGKDHLYTVAERLPDRAKHRRAVRVIDFADARAESAGESYSRAVIHRHRFLQPELQQQFNTSAGRFRVDFYWREQRLVGEFDGAVKYGRGDAAIAPSWDTLRQEKRREDAIRETGARFVRWSWEDIAKEAQHPESLVQRLVRAGLPRSRRR